jgi:hypothetical protein
VVSKAKKTMKPSEGNEVKEAINEFDEFVASVLQTTDSENIPPEESGANTGDSITVGKKTKKPKRAPTKKTTTSGGNGTKGAPKRKKRGVVQDSDDDEGEDDHEEQEEEVEEEDQKETVKTTRRPREPLQTKGRK